jgi:hypothetical protein
MLVTSDNTMASSRVGQLLLAAAGERSITDLGWREYLEFSASSVKNDGPFSGVLFWAPTQGPTGSQRKMLTEEYAEAVRIDAQRCVALISDSTMVRGALTAINWFAKKNMRAFARTDIQQALDWMADEIEFDRQEAEQALGLIIVAVQRQLERAPVITK